MRRLFLAAVLASLGCSSETTARITVEPGSLQPQSLRVFLWGEGLLRPAIDLPLGTHLLPATVILRHLDAHTPDFRLLIDGLDGGGSIESQAGAHVPLESGQQTSVTLSLSDGLLPDSDGDGVPDVVDDCPTVSDANQLCTAMRADGAVDLATTMRPADLAGVDLAGADLSVAHDLAQPPDLRGDDLLRGPACPSFALFCDDFEEGFFDTVKWQSKYDEGSGSTILVDNAQSLSGTQSAEVMTTSGSGLVWQAHTFTNITGGMVAVRAYFYSDVPMTPSVYFLYLHRQGTAPVDSDYVVGYDSITGSSAWTVFNKNSGDDWIEPVSAADQVWHCLELDVTLNGDGSNKMEFFVDGTARTPVTVPSASGATTLGEFDIGVSYLSDTTANHYHIDDVVLATQHIGCE